MTTSIALLITACAVTFDIRLQALALLVSALFGSFTLIWKSWVLRQAILNLHALRYPSPPWTFSWLAMLVLGLTIPTAALYVFVRARFLLVDPFTVHTRSLILAVFLMIVYVCAVLIVPFVLARVYYQSLSVGEQRPPRLMVGVAAAFTTYSLTLSGYAMKEAAPKLAKFYGIPPAEKVILIMGYVCVAASFLWQRRFLKNVSEAQQVAFATAGQRAIPAVELAASRTHHFGIALIAAVVAIGAIGGLLALDAPILRAWMRG